MNKVTKYIPIGILIFIFLSGPAFPSGRAEEPAGKQEARVFWILDGAMSAESAEMFLERYLFPTSLALMLWTEFSLQGQEVRFDTSGGYRVVRKQRVLAEPLGEYAVYGYDLIIDVTRPAEGRPAEAPGSGARPASRRTAFGEKQKSYMVQFSYPESADPLSGSPPKAGVHQGVRPSGVRPSGVLPQPLEQALLAGIRADGRPTGKARVEQIEYLGSGRFRATVLVGD
jgi:hypothetical protein